MSPKLIFGTGGLGMAPGSFQDTDSVRPLISTLKELGITHLDTAARYPPPSPGLAEKLVGETADGFVVDTKVLTDTRTDGSGDLVKEKMDASVGESLGRLKRERVNVLYSHRADPATPLKEQVQNFNEQIQLGHCNHWGVSNTPPNVLEEMLRICDENGWQKPRYYQGSYSLITRGMETKLLPILRSAGMHFNGYQPLAAGFLTGKFVNNDYTGTRFDPASPVGNIMQKMFSGDQLIVAMKKFEAAVQEKGLTSREVAIRWLMHHSVLNDEDGIILGASRIEQVHETIALTKKGPLEDVILVLAEELWLDMKSLRGEIL
ncbi:aflatoxin B1 aldehyde reductase-like protein [Karstenula rhodostoma CBS 690.94]|uniref:Aflatoxin B1 aldehyde reductase-like protein n=1 Tax=Karstenula rhodostoma CBS 690.94 TaxID=1392251 RepID=A0A9P4PTR8_9PLEO|nr:aflatoxin B1 aldehyde reductase-like protein [Karstenula rhodostoma CBS 690.94]